jgi:hypothetical protein
LFKKYDKNIKPLSKNERPQNLAKTEIYINPNCNTISDGKTISEKFGWERTYFFKFVDKTRKHFGHVFTLGLNIDSVPFDVSKNCSSGGLYFADMQNILTYSSFGHHIAIIRLLDDSVVYCEDAKYKTNCLYICGYIDPQSLQYLDIDTINKILSKNNLVTDEYFKMFPNDIKYFKNTASQKMLTNAVKHNGESLKYILH